MFSRKRILLAAVGIAGIGALTVAADRAIAAQATATTNATIVTPIAISNVNSLEFGKVAAGTASSVVRISSAGARSLVSGDATLVSGGTIQAASFSVTGEASTGYAITLPSSITISAGANNMTVNTFTDSKGGTSTLDGTGNDTFTVGADLTVGASQAAGAYTGTFNVTVNYN
ncbi:MAG: DUF4402 domain-containing protein [Kiloniellaceae bacterium]